MVLSPTSHHSVLHCTSDSPDGADAGSRERDRVSKWEWVKLVLLAVAISAVTTGAMSAVLLWAWLK
jgi:hypothetical protein